MKLRGKRFDLLKQVINQLATSAYRYCWNIVDRFIWIKFDTLTADFGQRVNDMRFYFKKSKLEHLEEPHWTGANNDCIGFNGGVQFTLPVGQVYF